MARGFCKVCQYSELLPLPPNVVLKPGQQHPLQCFRNPPQVVIVPKQGAIQGNMMLSAESVSPVPDLTKQYGCCEPALTVDNSNRAERRRQD
jgi:hypothetical protein